MCFVFFSLTVIRQSWYLSTLIFILQMSLYIMLSMCIYLRELEVVLNTKPIYQLQTNNLLSSPEYFAYEIYCSLVNLALWLPRTGNFSPFASQFRKVPRELHRPFCNTVWNRQTHTADRSLAFITKLNWNRIL